MKVVTIIGARPQIIKAAAISREISRKYCNSVTEIIVHTGQHYDQNMSEVFFDELSIPRPNYNLNVGSNSHGVQTAKMIEGIEDITLKETPDYILLYGDTNSTLAGAIAASKLNVPVVHIEAGLRSFNRTMPEEINRVICDHISTFLFSPTATGFNNLVREGFNPQNESPYTPDNPGVFHCGDIMYDNSLHFAELAAIKSIILDKYDLEPNNFVLSTIHRDHNTDDEDSLMSIFRALLEIAKKVKVVLPLHPRTKNRLENLSDKDFYQRVIADERLMLVPPVSFLDMIQLEKCAKMVITDSGGVQKEAYFFEKPCIILRPETEWVEIIETGMAKLVSADYDMILEVFRSFINKDELAFPSIFGNGKASEFICKKLF